MDEKLYIQAKKQAEYCRVFSSAKRILILWILGTGEMSVSEIASALDISLQNTSQHLRLMKDKGILISRRESQNIFYRVEINDCLIGRYLIEMQIHQVVKTKIIEKQI